MLFVLLLSGSSACSRMVAQDYGTKTAEMSDTEKGILAIVVAAVFIYSMKDDDDDKAEAEAEAEAK